MKTFREHLNEEVAIGALASGGIDIERDAIRDEINGILAGIAARPCVTPYASLNKVRKALAYFHIHLPKKVYLEGRHGIEVWEVNQFGIKMGVTDTGEWINHVPAKYYLFFHYHLMGSMYYLQAKIVDEKELESKISYAEGMVAEETDAATRQAVTKAAAPKEEPHTALGDCDCSQGDSPSTKKAVDTSMKKQIDEVSLGKLVRYKNKAGEGREKGVALADKKMKGKAKVNASMPKNAYMEEDKDPCWKGYEMVGMKKKGGRKVPNCVPVKEEQIDEVSKELAARYRKKAHASYTYAAGKREDDRFHEKGGKDMKDVFGKPKFKDRPESEKAKDEKTIGKRLKGLTMAHKRLKEEQIDEVSKELLKRYTNKVAKGGLNKAYEKDTKIADPAKRHSLPNYNKRLEYGFKATAKIAKEETQIDEHKSMDGDSLKVGDSVGFKDGHEQYGKIHSISDQGHAKVKVWDSEAGEHYHVTKHVSRLWKEANEEVAIQEGRPRKNPTPETTERDPRKHIQVEAGRAAAGNVVDFHHNDGSKSKITPAMGRKITSHLQSLKPADRQAAVNKMHDSAEGLKV